MDSSGENTEDVEKMILEMGDLDEEVATSCPRQIDELKTALSNRDSLIKR